MSLSNSLEVLPDVRTRAFKHRLCFEVLQKSAEALFLTWWLNIILRFNLGTFNHQ